MPRRQKNQTNKRIAGQAAKRPVAPLGWLPMSRMSRRRVGGACPYMTAPEPAPEESDAYFGGAEMDMVPARLPPPPPPYYAPGASCGPSCGAAYRPSPYMYPVGMHPVGGLSFSDISSKVCLRARCRYAKDAIMRVRKLATELQTIRDKNPNDTRDAGAAWDTLIAAVRKAASDFENDTTVKAIL